MSIKGREDTKVVIYDTVENGRPLKKIMVEHGNVLTGTFRDFIGSVNDKGQLIRKITVAVPPSVADYIRDNGVPLGRWVPDGTSEDEMDDYDPILTIKINYSYWKPPKIESKKGKDGIAKEVAENSVFELQKKQFDDSLIIGRIVNGVHSITHRPYTTVYLDQASFTVHKDERPKIEEEMLREYGSSFIDASDEELPFEEE